MPRITIIRTQFGSLWLGPLGQSRDRRNSGSMWPSPCTFSGAWTFRFDLAQSRVHARLCRRRQQTTWQVKYPPWTHQNQNTITINFSWYFKACWWFPSFGSWSRRIPKLLFFDVRKGRTCEPVNWCPGVSNYSVWLRLLLLCHVLRFQCGLQFPWHRATWLTEYMTWLCNFMMHVWTTIKCSSHS